MNKNTITTVSIAQNNEETKQSSRWESGGAYSERTPPALYIATVLDAFVSKGHDSFSDMILETIRFSKSPLVADFLRGIAHANRLWWASSGDDPDDCIKVTVDVGRMIGSREMTKEHLVQIGAMQRYGIEVVNMPNQPSDTPADNGE